MPHRHHRRKTHRARHRRRHTRRVSSAKRNTQFAFQNAFTRSHAGEYQFYAVHANDVPKGPEDIPLSVIQALPHVQIDDMLARPTEKFVLYFTEDDRLLCILTFKIQERPNVAELSMISCPRKAATIRPTSAVLFYRLAAILQAAGIEFIALTVVATGEKYWRLFELYGSYGFHCVPIEEETMEVNIDAAIGRLTAGESEGFLAAETAKGDDAKADSFAYYRNCFGMVARVSDVLAATGALLGLSR